MVSKDAQSGDSPQELNSNTSLTARSRNEGVSKPSSDGRICGGIRQQQNNEAPLCSFSQLGAVSPRRRIDIKVFSDRIVLCAPGRMTVSVMISLNTPVLFGKQRIPRFVFSFARRSQSSLEYDEVVEEGPSWLLLANALKRSSKKPLYEPSEMLDAVPVTMGTAAGHLFFFDSCFIFGDKPPTCIRYEDICAVDLHRIRFGSLFDMILTVQDCDKGEKERAVSFRNIDNGVFKDVEKFLSQSIGLSIGKVDSSIGGNE